MRRDSLSGFDERRALSRRCLLLLGGAALLAAAVPALAQQKKPAAPPKKPPTRSTSRSRRSSRNTTSKPASQPAASLPVHDGPPTVGSTIALFKHVGLKQLRQDEIALLAALEFCRGVAGLDAGRAGEQLDATGYQPLPLAGPLAQEPPRPVLAAALREATSLKDAVSIDEVPLDRFQVTRRTGLEQHFPHLAEWMLPDDYAVLIEPDAGAAEWVRSKCMLVVRVRGRKAAVMGGNVLAALAAPKP